MNEPSLSSSVSSPDCTDVDVPQWIKAMPKVELHAHLSGSIPLDTIRHLLRTAQSEKCGEKQHTEPQPEPATGMHEKDSNFHTASPLLNSTEHLLKDASSLQRCFELFPLIHALVQDTDTLRYVVHQVLHQFQLDGVVYVELRTTPRATARMSMEQYLATVVDAVDEFHQSSKPNPDTDADAASVPGSLVCRILVSMSRHLPVHDAEQVVDLLERWFLHSDNDNNDINNNGTEKNKENDVEAATTRRRRSVVVGVELSGNPCKGRWEDFEPLLHRVRDRMGLPVSLHFAEVDNEDEAFQMLAFRPDRVGHAVVMSPAVCTALMDARTPVEVCLTSNVVARSVSSVHNHPAVTHLIPAARNTVCICTDDCLLLDTSLSKEYAVLRKAMGLSQEQVRKLAKQSLQAAFCRDEQVLEQVKQLMERCVAS